MTTPTYDYDKAAYQRAADDDWTTQLHDPGTGNWQDHWFLDGEIAAASNSAKGLQLTAGPRWRDNSHHMVLWTKDEYHGDVRIDFDYTRLDFATRAVNIIYIQATGSGDDTHPTDITEWNHLRTTPAMSQYFDHMHTYHVSFAAMGNKPEDAGDYIRARRYQPGHGIAGTDMEPDYFDTDLFAPGIPHSISVIKRATTISMRIQTAGKPDYYCHWDTTNVPPIDHGRIGFRLMFTRSARFSDIRISSPTSQPH